MTENKQPLDKNDVSVDPIMIGQPYARSAGTSIGSGLATEKNGPTITHQPDAHPTDRGMSTGLARALMGGLIGATLGTLVGALANKRTSEGVNHAAKGVGVAVKSVAEGVNQAAKGVGVAVKSVAEGVNHAVIGGAVDAVKNTSEDAKQSVVAAVDAVKNTSEDAKQSVVAAVDAVKSTAEDVKASDHQNVKLYEERLITGNKQVTTDSVGKEAQVETQSGDISAPLKKEQLVVEPTISIGAGTPVAPSEADFYQE